ncbi:histidine kinase [Wenyingzhuangia sp. chi5]|uniref:Histidine kinase n=1 Tax=Wenyingzhuangia gilva TaxID=3057677 RepID=A0ABT8VTD2_9FLAO|nr:histidine kinase [Wenyingzhuangia sp. chi5]MDO3695234.1 histidine kinase [Wenyingzhuangia sp. chi5]
MIVTFSAPKKSELNIDLINNTLFNNGDDDGFYVDETNQYIVKSELFVNNDKESEYNRLSKLKIAEALVRFNNKTPINFPGASDIHVLGVKKNPLDTLEIFIKEIYNLDFEKNLKIANKQFDYIIDDIYKERVKRRDRDLWWVQNPEAVLALPALLLLLLFLFILKKIDIALEFKIKNRNFKFIIVATISLIFISFLISCWDYSYKFLEFPVKYRSNHSFLETIFMKFVDVSGMGLLLPIILFLRFIENKIKKTSQGLFIKTALIFLSTGILPFIAIFLMMYFSGNLNSDAQYLRLSEFFLYTMSIAVIRSLISFFIFKERNLIVENEMKLSNLRELKTKAELTSLQSQINPHFLYNALNSIASLAHTNADKTEKMALSLSDLFKYTINRKDKKISTVNDELEMVRSYLEIEQTRFGDRLEFVINVEDEVLQEEIPMFLLQPLVENAVKHGVSKIEDKGVIKLNIIKKDKGLEIEVTDNGPDFPEGLVSGHGLQTVYDLLRLSYGDKAALKWQNTPQKSICILIDKTA